MEIINPLMVDEIIPQWNWVVFHPLCHLTNQVFLFITFHEILVVLRFQDPFNGL